MLMKTANETSDAYSVLFFIASVQFVIATLHVAVCLQQAINGFIRSPDPAFYFSPEGDTGVPLQTAELSLYVTNVSVATFVVSRTEA